MRKLAAMAILLAIALALPCFAFPATMSGNFPVTWTAAGVYNDGQAAVVATPTNPGSPAVQPTPIPTANLKGFMVYCAVVVSGATHVPNTYDNATRYPSTARSGNCPVTSDGPPVRVYAAVTQLVTLAMNPADLSEYESAYSNELTALVTTLNLSPSKAPLSVKGTVTTICIPDPVIGAGKPVPCMTIISP